MCYKAGRQEKMALWGTSTKVSGVSEKALQNMAGMETGDCVGAGPLAPIRSASGFEFLL